MKDFENKIFGVLFFGLWIVVLYHLLTRSSDAVRLASGLTNPVNSFFGTLFTARAVNA